MRRAVSRVAFLLITASAFAQPAALSVNPASREEVRQFYRAIYFASENVPMDWSGSYARGLAGETSARFKEATRLRINFFRALAGVPADITFEAEFNRDTQGAALLMSANDDLTHTPPASWIFYNPAAALAAANSNLALGFAGPAAIDRYMADAGATNAAVGHRRWLLYPQTLRMGSGDVPGVFNDDTRRPANAVWVLDPRPPGNFGAPRPTTRTTAVPYPPAGFVPHTLVWPRWSLSLPEADLSSATVTMTRNGEPISLQQEPIDPAPIGEPTLVWLPEGVDFDHDRPHPRPPADTAYRVTVQGARVAGVAQTLIYDVIVFDPDVASPEATSVTISGRASPIVGEPNIYAVRTPPFATGFEWRIVNLAGFEKTYTAENGLEGLRPRTTPGYAVVQTAVSARGLRAYRLAHATPREDQVLLLPDTYFVSGTDATVTFQSRLGIATPTETARVQVSTDDGVTWIDVFSQSGTSATRTAFPAATEQAFEPRVILLHEYAGRSIHVRFVYSIGSGDAFMPEPANHVGWFIDDLRLTHVQTLTATAPQRTGGGEGFSFRPAVAGATALQARSVLFDAYPAEWGPVTQLSAIAPEQARNGSYLANLSVRTTAGAGPQSLIVGFTVAGGTKPLLLRGIGPGLDALGIAKTLADPRLDLYDADSRHIAQNDNWRAADAEAFRRVGAFSLRANSRDAALATALPAGSYTARVSGASGPSGTALVELYDSPGGTPGARLVNMSARARVGPAGESLVAGFNLAGDKPRTLLIRAIGPALARFGVTDALADPKLELFSQGEKLATNDDWAVASRASFAQVGAFDLPEGSRDAALLITLAPGSYTAQISGGDASGTTLMEIYEVP